MTISRDNGSSSHNPNHPTPNCPKCGTELQWVDCWKCGGEGYTDHDCGEDTCCCSNPELNVVCDACLGEQGFDLCLKCHPEAFRD